MLPVHSQSGRGRVGGSCSALTVTDPLGLALLKQWWALEGMESQQRGEQNHRLMLIFEEECLRLNLEEIEKVVVDWLRQEMEMQEKT